MAGGSVGTIFAELDLDASRYTRGQQKLLQDATSTTLNIEANFKKLGIKSSAEMDLMRQKITNSFEMIKHSAQATTNDIMRAEQAKNSKLKALNEQQFGHQASLMETAKKNWLALAAVAYTAMRTMRAGWTMMEEAANFEQQEKSFNRLAASYGADGDAIISELKSISEGTINTMTLVEKAGTAMMMGIAPDKVSKLMEIARATAKMTGESVTKSFEDISLAVGRQSKMILDNLGIIVSAGTANDKYAASLGKTALQLTDSEKKTAFLNATIEAGEELMERLGKQSDTNRDKMDQFTTAASELRREIGTLALSFTSLLQATTEAMQGMEMMFGQSAIAKLERQRMDIIAEIHSIEESLSRSGPMQSLSNWINGLFGQDVVGEQKARLAELKTELMDISKLLNAPKKVTGARSGAGTEAPLIDLTEQKKVLAQFTKEYTRAMRGMTEVEIEELNIRIDKYRQYGADEVKLEEMKQAELKQIMIRANNEHIALLEELFAITGNAEYANAAIDLMAQILDAEQEKWSQILGSDEDAYALREKRDWDYYKHLFGMIDDRVDHERHAIRDVVDYASDELSSISSSGGGGGGGGGGAGGGMAGGFPLINDPKYYAFYDAVLGTDLTGNKKRAVDQAAWAEKQAAEAADSAAEIARITEDIARENERIADEYQREYESRVSTLTNLHGQFSGYMQGRERKSWGQAEYQQEFSRLATEFGSSKYFDTSIDLLSQMLDVVKELDTIEQEQLAQQKQTAANLKESSQSISDWLSDLSQGALAPVQSAGGWAAKFEELRAAAMADEGKVADFLSYAQKYLQFEKGYGTSGSYQAAYQSVVSSVSDLQTLYDLSSKLANLGLGESLSDINKLIEAFGNLGVSASALNDAATAAGAQGIAQLANAVGVTLSGATDAASGKTGSLSDVLMGTETPFANVSAAVSAMASGVQLKLTEVSGFFTSLATGLGVDFNSGTVGTASAALKPVVYEPPSVMSAWQWHGGTNWERRGTGEHYYSLVSPVWANGEWWLALSDSTWKGMTSDARYPTPGGLAGGGITNGLTMAGESGPEWVVPTYEPQRSSFLKDVGADPETIGRAIARNIQGLGGGGGDIHVSVQIDGREIGNVVARQIPRNRDLTESIRRLN